MSVRFRPRYQRIASNLGTPVCISLFLTAGRLAGACARNCPQFTALHGIQHGDPPSRRFLGCGPARFLSLLTSFQAA